MNKQINLAGIRNITISGRIGSGSTTLAKALSKKLGWKHIEGGEVFWEQVRSRLNLESKDTNKRPDSEDQDFDAQLKKMLKEDSHLILETKLAGFNAQGIDGVFKILVLCEDENGVDQAAVRIDRLLNREDLTLEQAKEEAFEREKNDIEKFRRLYANGDENWVYWDKNYYDLIVNTYSHNADQSLQHTLEALGSF
jgi:CMP/dCMP kinase